jgi:methylated-DNA-[protein]-cysteine S-methyltransferase
VIRYAELASPIGPLRIVDGPDGVLGVWFETGKRRRPVDPGWRRVETDAIQAAVQLAEYFAGGRRTFALRLAPLGTPFQRRVWDAVAAIPYGETRSYGSIAAEIAAPRAVRAVGAANGHNPWPIIVPCHRVVGRTGALTGYGGGLAIKRALIDFEQGLGPLFPAAHTSGHGPAPGYQRTTTAV